MKDWKSVNLVHEFSEQGVDCYIGRKHSALES